MNLIIQKWNFIRGTPTQEEEKREKGLGYFKCGENGEFDKVDTKLGTFLYSSSVVFLPRKTNDTK